MRIMLHWPSFHLLNLPPMAAWKKKKIVQCKCYYTNDSEYILTYFWNRKVKRGVRTAYTRAANTYLRSNQFFQSWKKKIFHWRQSKPCTHIANMVHVAVHMASYLFPHSQPRLECTSICFTRLKTILDARWMWIQHGSPEPMMVFMYGSSWHSLPPRVAWTLWTRAESGSRRPVSFHPQNKSASSDYASSKHICYMC